LRNQKGTNDLAYEEEGEGKKAERTTTACPLRIAATPTQKHRETLYDAEGREERERRKERGEES